MVRDKVANILAEILGIYAEDITVQTEFTSEFGIEPLDVAKLVINVEKEFKIRIYDDQAAEFRNVGDIVRRVNKLLDRESRCDNAN